MNTAKFKWSEELANRVSQMYDGGDGETPEAIAKALSNDDYKVTHRMVIGKLTNMGQYVVPQPAPKAAKEPTVAKREIVESFEKSGFVLESLSKMTIADLVKLAGFMNVRIPDPK